MRSRPVLILALTILAAVLPVACDVDASAGTGLDMSVPVTDGSGMVTLLRARLCRPDNASPAPLAVIAHGSPPDAAARPRMRLGRCDGEAARWFTDRGFVVAFALRRGYGATGGPWAEGTGGCTEAGFVHGGQETARDIAAVVDGATALPFVRPDRAVVVGQSAGGWGAIAYDSLPHGKVAAFVVMAGGRGGHVGDRPNANCRPDQLAAAAGRFGASATTPMLWVYARNDSYFAPPIAEAMRDAFTASGGQVTLLQPEAFDGDGHRLFFGQGGSAIWGPAVAAYLSTRGVTGR